MNRKTLIFLFCIVSFSLPLAAQDPQQPVEVTVDDLQATPAGISLTLRAADDRGLHMMIGLAEGQSIVLALRNEKPERPLGHDLFKAFLDRNGWKVQKVLIRELKDGTYFSDLTIEKPNHETQVYDARPSDAMAMGIRYGAKIYVNPQVFEQETKNRGGDDAQPQDQGKDPDKLKSSEPEEMKL